MPLFPAWFYTRQNDNLGKTNTPLADALIATRYLGYRIETAEKKLEAVEHVLQLLEQLKISEHACLTAIKVILQTK